ncbi:MAG: hypothetical protein RMH81_06955 [Thermomicrobium sp.]|nr:hypothetical protein [Thermomicrobium sp.]
MTDRPDTLPFTDQLRNTVARCRAELGETGRSLEEIDLLLAQTVSEVERLSQREIQLSTRLREVETNLEAYPRSEIRDAYRSVHEVTLRLFMLRNQVEQLEERRRSLLLYQERLRELLSLAESQLTATIERSSERRVRLLAAPSQPLPPDETVALAERERAAVRRALEHGLAQLLSAVVLEAEVCLQLERQRPEELRAGLLRLRELAREAVHDLRRTLLELAPSQLDELGLVATLHRYVRELARASRLERFEVSGPDRDDSLPSGFAPLVYRLLQATSSHLARHAGVTELTVDVRYEPAQLVARFEAAGPAPLDPLPPLDPLVTERLAQLGASLASEELAPERLRWTVLVPLT